MGYADETGEGDRGEGANLNYPLVHGTEWPAYAGGPRTTPCAKIAAYGPDVRGDLPRRRHLQGTTRSPSSSLESDNYPEIGELIAKLRRPTLFVMEGGYAVEEIGINAVGVLTGFEGAGE